MGRRLGLVTTAALGVLPFGGRATWSTVVAALAVLLGVLVVREVRSRHPTAR
jgi:hypothetical protein